MNRFLIRFTLVVISVVYGATDDAIAQRFHGHHHHHYHHAAPYCGGGVFVWEQFIGAPIVETFWLAPLPTVIRQPVEIVPFAPVIRPPLEAQVLAGRENFARKEMIPANRPAVGAPRADNFNDADEIRRRASVLKSSSPTGRARADRLIASGDQAFADQILARATARYREAIAKAPDYAEAHFRLAHAYVATRRYNLALKSVLVALELAGTGRRDGFSLEDMYQGDQFAREQHLRTLVDASLREPVDGGLQFLIGFTLHFDAQPELAQAYFRAAGNLDGIHKSYVRYFLPVKLVEEPAEVAN